MEHMNHAFKTGDILLYNTTKYWYSRLIERFTSSDYTHVAWPRIDRRGVLRAGERQRAFSRRGFRRVQIRGSSGSVLQSVGGIRVSGLRPFVCAPHPTARFWPTADSWNQSRIRKIQVVSVWPESLRLDQMLLWRAQDPGTDWGLPQPQ